MKNSILLFFLVFLFHGCQYFEKNVPKKEELLHKELSKINWSQVDEFPSVIQCDSITNKEIRKQCFFDYLTQAIQQKLTADTSKNLYSNIDTLHVKVTVLTDATLRFVPIFSKDSTAYNTVKIDSVLQSRLSNFPMVEPAIKRGIKVRSEFILPIVLKVD
jgi:hypothetical protein